MTKKKSFETADIVPVERLERQIYLVRGQKVMLDRDLAKLYGVTTGRLNEAVGRNRDRFPEDFMFQLDGGEFKDWISQIAISNPSIKMSARRRPYAFTEQGVAMLLSIRTRSAPPDAPRKAFVSLNSKTKTKSPPPPSLAITEKRKKTPPTARASCCSKVRRPSR